MTCLKFMNNCLIPKELNTISIVLIPKKRSPEKLSEMRLIALCNVVYKIVSKAIANQLKAILPLLISDSQSVFILDRLITDNIMIAFEVCHHLKKKRQGKKGLAALKIDMSKAYDQGEWNFLQVKVGLPCKTGGSCYAVCELS